MIGAIFTKLGRAPTMQAIKGSRAGCEVIRFRISTRQNVTDRASGSPRQFLTPTLAAISLELTDPSDIAEQIPPPSRAARLRSFLEVLVDKVPIQKPVNAHLERCLRMISQYPLRFGNIGVGDRHARRVGRPSIGFSQFLPRAASIVRIKSINRTGCEFPRLKTSNRQSYARAPAIPCTVSSTNV